MKLHVVIPSWSRLTPEMEVETGCRCAALIPLGGKPLYKHLIDLYDGSEISSHFVLVLAEDTSPTDVDFPLGVDGDIERLAHSTSIGETVLAGLSDILPGDATVIHMADTLVELGGPLVLDTIYTQLRSDLYRWTNVIDVGDGQIRFPHDRDNFEPIVAPQSVCVGLFTFRDGQRFRCALQEALDHGDGLHEPFFVAIEHYSGVRPMTLTTASSWFDCGHVDTYYESRLGYQNLRHFNTLTYEPTKGQVTKTSIMVDRFRHQVRWFKQVPDALAAFLPRVFESSDGAEPFITMELLSIPTLGELFITERLNLGAWNGVVRTIAHILSEFSASSYRTTLGSQLTENMYLDKTKNRLAEFVEQDSRALAYWVQIDGKRWTIPRVLESLDEFVVANGLISYDCLCPIHGDFCFSNLLYDPRGRLVKMIDPRGEFGVPGIYGDPRYDLAKLAHSYDGGYDFIVSDRFAVTVEGTGEIHLLMGMGPYHDRVRAIFDAILLGDQALKRQVSALEALLFLSMLPLHVDTPERQLAMLATGLRLFAQTVTTPPHS